MDPLRKSDPQTIGPARLVARLGSGGMGTVYLASINGASVALKVVRGNFYDDPALRTRFEREISTMQSLQSPFVARVIDSNVEEDEAWLAIEFVNGDNISQRVQNQGPLGDQEWWTTLCASLIALEEIHGRGVLHRDVKPANILLSESGPKFVDFGIAQAGEETSLTATGLLAGSPAWLAPEQLEDHHPTSAADIFSLASTMVFAATGASPWGNPTQTAAPALFNRILNEPPRVDQLSPAQREVLEPMLHKDPSKRPPASELVAAVLVGQSSVVKKKIAGWISLYYLTQGFDDFPDGEAAVRALELLEYNDRAERERVAQTAQDGARELQNELIEAAKVEVELAKASADQEIRDARRSLEREAQAIEAARAKSAAEAAKILKKAEAEAQAARKRAATEAEAQRRKAKRLAISEARKVQRGANRRGPAAAMSQALEGSKRRISWKAVIPALMMIALVAAGWAVSRGGSNEELSRTSIAVESRDSVGSSGSGDSQTPQRDGIEESYGFSVFPSDGDLLEDGEPFRPAITFDRNYEFAPGGEPSVEIVPLEDQVFSADSDSCTRPGGAKMTDGLPPSYGTGCVIFGEGEWLLQFSWIPAGAEGDAFSRRASVSVTVLVVEEIRENQAETGCFYGGQPSPC